MAKIEIRINGKAYPCRQTMGAMLRFKHKTGKDVTEISGNNVSDLCTFLWCCVASACKADGVDFDMELMDFADSISPEDLMEWSNANVETSANQSDGEKKSQ